jgi:hypothetical protein
MRVSDYAVRGVSPNEVTPSRSTLPFVPREAHLESRALRGRVAAPPARGACCSGCAGQSNRDRSVAGANAYRSFAIPSRHRDTKGMRSSIAEVTLSNAIRYKPPLVLSTDEEKEEPPTDTGGGTESGGTPQEEGPDAPAGPDEPVDPQEVETVVVRGQKPPPPPPDVPFTLDPRLAIPDAPPAPAGPRASAGGAPSGPEETVLVRGKKRQRPDQPFQPDPRVIAPDPDGPNSGGRPGAGGGFRQLRCPDNNPHCNACPDGLASCLKNCDTYVGNDVYAQCIKNGGMKYYCEGIRFALRADCKDRRCGRCTEP